ncbi:MAG: hypothetical protein H6670_10390 [Anaerolineaceae bacterium]|nr:hypothetical protein [Anaerolineaceae bacterium]
MRQYRWQILALLVAGSIFAVAIGFRLLRQPGPIPEVTATPSATNAETTSLPEATPLPVDTPQPDASTGNSNQVIQPMNNVRASENTFVEALVGHVQRLTPLLAIGNSAEEDITSLIFEGLVKINDFGEPSPVLAKDWTVSGTGLDYVFELRDDVLWQDGLPFTADDVIFTASLLASEQFPGVPQLSAFWRTVETEKLNDYLVRFRLTQPLANFTDALTIGILPKHVLDGIQPGDLLNHPFNLAPIGTGPYQLANLRSENGEQIDAVDLVAAPNYAARNGVPTYHITHFRFTLFDSFDAAQSALASGLVDGLADQNMSERAQLTNLPEVEAYTAIAPEVGMLIFNWDEPDDARFFSEQRVRWALQLSLNRESAINMALSNQVIIANSPILPTSWAYLQGIAWSGMDIGRAQSYIQNISLVREPGPASEGDSENTEETSSSVGESENDSGTIYSFTILVPQDDALVAIATSYAGQWQVLNLNVTVEAVEETIFQQRLDAGDFDAAIVEYPLSADPDTYAYWHIGQAPDGLNYGAVADDRISELLERARRDPMGPNRLPLYQSFQRLFVERAIAIPLYYPLFTYAVRDNISGVQLSFISQPSDRFRTLADWQIN